MKKLLLLSTIIFFAFAPPRQKIFVIGDSISIHYHEFLPSCIAEKFDYERKQDDGGEKAADNLDNPQGANGGDSRMVLDYIRKMKRNNRLKTDYLMINCGLHDIKVDVKTGKVAIPIEQYQKNLDSIYREVAAAGIKMIWVNSTPVDDQIHNSKGVAFHRFNRDVVAYNAVADEFFRANRVPIIDLYSFSAQFPRDAYMDHVHYKTEYRKLQAAYIAGFLMNNNQAPSNREQLRVACVGNSITEGAGIAQKATHSYPAQLQQMLGSRYEVRNFGLSGRTVLKKGDNPYLNEPAYQQALQFEPNIVVIKLGTNDSKAHNWRHKADFEADLTALIVSFKRLESSPVIYLCRPIKAFKMMWDIDNDVLENEVYPLIERVAKRQGCKLIDTYTPLANREDLLPDKIHPNEQGASVIAQTVAQAIAN